METPQYPTHSVVGIFLENGHRIQTQKLKFHPGSETPEAAGRKRVEEFLKNVKRPTTIESVTVAALKPPKLGARLNKQHDYVTLRATFLDGSLSMTSSWSRISLGGDFVGRTESSSLFNAAVGYEKRTKLMLAGRMDTLLGIAQKAKTFAEFSREATENLNSLN